MRCCYVIGKLQLTCKENSRLQYEYGTLKISGIIPVIHFKMLHTRLHLSLTDLLVYRYPAYAYSTVFALCWRSNINENHRLLDARCNLL